MTELDKKIEELEKELSVLKTERDAISDDDIKPSETKNLIEKYYGYYFCFENPENLKVCIKLRTIKIDRDNKQIWLCGPTVMHLHDYSTYHYTKGLTFVKNDYIKYNIQVGDIVCWGEIDLGNLPNIKFDWNDKEYGRYFGIDKNDEEIEKMSLYQILDAMFNSHMISYQKFFNDVHNVAEYFDDDEFDLDSLEDIKRNKDIGPAHQASYDYIYGKL